MKSKFNQIYEKIISQSQIENCLVVEDIKNIQLKANNLVYETNNILKCPQKLISLVKQKVLLLIKNNNYNEEKIFINDICLFDKNLSIKDQNLLNTIKQLFQNHLSAFFTVRIAGDKDLWFDKKR